MVQREIFEEAVIVGALTIFETLELDLTRLLTFSVVDAFARVGDITGIDGVKDIKLQSPNNISGVFNVARFFETLE